VDTAFGSKYSECQTIMATTVLQATAGVVLMLVGFTGWPVVRLGKFERRPMTRLRQCLVIGDFGTAVFVPAVQLISGRQAGVAQLRHWGVVLNSDASLVMMFVGGLFLYMRFVAKRLSGGKPLRLKMFRA
jgi:hypothetical protein